MFTAFGDSAFSDASQQTLQQTKNRIALTRYDLLCHTLLLLALEASKLAAMQSCVVFLADFCYMLIK